MKTDSKKIILNRDVTQKECPWLDRDYNKGEILYKYTDHTYGIITAQGIAATEKIDERPFFEIPYLATI